MLTIDPEQRISATKALDDPWIKMYRKTSKDEGLAIAALGRIKVVKTCKRIQQAAIQYIVKKLATKEDIDELTLAF